MRLPILLIGLVLTAAIGFAIWALLVLPQAKPDTIRHIATTQPVERAVEQTALAAEAIELPPDLSTREGSDWPSFLGPTHDGKSPERGIKVYGEAGPRVVWTTEAGEGYAAPCVSRGRLLIFDRVRSRARCRCLHAETGAELWRFSYATDYQDRQGYDGGPRASPVADSYRVYLYGAEGWLHCLRLQDGQLLWKVNTLATFGVVQNLFGVASAPLIDEERVIVQVGGSGEGSSDQAFMDLESNGSCIVAFDRQTGQVLYQGGRDLAGYASPQVVSLGGRKTGLMFARSGLLAFDPATGVELLRHPFRSRSYNSVNASNVVVQDDRLFLTESYQLGCAQFAWKDNTLTPTWSATPKEPDRGLCCHWNTPILVDGCLYGCASRLRGDAELRCVDWNTGKVNWIAKPTLKDQPAGRSSMIFADGHFLDLSEDGWLFLFKANPANYEPICVWDGTTPGDNGAERKRLLKEPCWAAPILSRGLLYLRGKDRLVCVDVR